MQRFLCGRNTKMTNETMIAAIALGFGLSGLMVGGLAILLVAQCWSKVEGLVNSTHQIQYVPIDSEEAITGKDLDKQMEKALSHEYNAERDFI